MAIGRDQAIFVNCPFDPEYKPLFDAIVFAIVFCGFRVRSALESSDAGEPRLLKIVRLIGESRLSIHDISRVEHSDGLPRFNMPIELGIAIGARHLGGEAVQDHRLLVLDAEPYRYQRFASDLAGLDIHAHGGSVSGAIGAVRNFLATQAGRTLPGTAAIRSALATFEIELPALAAAARQAPDEITYVDRIEHILSFLEGSA